MTRAGRLALLAVASAVVSAALCGLWPTVQAADDEIRLTPGRNAVTWNGPAPYALSNFDGTPVTQVHRWDAIRQEWLAHIIGQDGATLPELHLLPRVQYLILAERSHTLAVADALAAVNPSAPLRFAPPPDDPLRFDAYWPNEDSPLEDLILLRPDDERLSVKAEVAGGTGEIEVYWLLDGRLNHRGLESDDVELLPGKHNDAMLYAVGGAGQVVAESLPRVVKLPQVAIPEMVYGVNEWALAIPPYDWYHVEVTRTYTTREAYVAAAEAMASLGLNYVRLVIWTNDLFVDSSLSPSRDIEHLDWLFGMLRDAGVEPLPVVGVWHGMSWAHAGDVQRTKPVFPGQKLSGGPLRERRLDEMIGRTAARRWPDVKFWDVSNEPNTNQSNAELDPRVEVLHQRALALGIWYENPDAIIVAGTPCCFWTDQWEWGIDGFTYLAAMYEEGFGPWHDIVGIHPTGDLDIATSEFDLLQRMMRRHGDDGKPVWATEMSYWGGKTGEHSPRELVELLQLMTERKDIGGAVIWKFSDDLHIQELFPNEALSGIVAPLRDGIVELQPAAIAVRDFIRAQTQHPND